MKGKAMYEIAETLLIIGGLNWGLALFDVNLVTLLFGAQSVVTTIVYAAVGLSAVWLGWFKWFKKK